LPEHWVVPGVHDPVQLPLTHAWLVHAVAVPQSPVVSQVCVAALPEHWVVPGVQTPEHAPLTHACLVHEIGEPKDPDALHVS
jgi:hypothetical protein